MRPGQLALKVGGYPLHLMRLRAKIGWRAIPMRRLENKLVADLLGQRGDRVHADVVTIITTYKRPEMLPLAVASALSQDIPDHRVIVVDDGGGGLPEFPPDPRLTVVSLPVNTGTAGVVRNVGIRISNSRLVAFLDDDNTWTPEHLPLSVAAHGGRAALSYSGIRRMHADGRVFDELNEPWSRHAMMRHAFVDTSAIVVRRGRGVAFSRMPRTRIASGPGEDWQFVYQISRFGKVVHVPEITVNYLLDGVSHYSEWRDPLVPQPDSTD
ncbi:MAG: glycosyltransferase family 2 protein [Actinomycetota bacterium]